MEGEGERGPKQPLYPRPTSEMLTIMKQDPLHIQARSSFHPVAAMILTWTVIGGTFPILDTNATRHADVAEPSGPIVDAACSFTT